MNEGQGQAPGPSQTEWGVFAGLMVLLAVISVGTYYHLGEDAFISFRYADNLASGRGLVFNIGEHVEGYSNLLWVLLLVPGEWIGLPMPLSARLLALAFLAAFVYTSWRTVRLLMPGGVPAWLTWWLPLAVVLEPLLRYHVDQGLETVPYVALLGMTLLVASRGGAVWAAGGLAAAATLTRPEGIGLALALAPAVWFAASREGNGAALRRTCLYAAIPLGAFLLQLAFRRAMYGEWVPNTVIAKDAATGGGLGEVLAYTASHAFMPVLAAAGVLLGLRSPRTRPLAAGALALALAAVLFQFRAGGLLNVGFRYLAPLAVPVLVGGWLLLDWLREVLEERRLPGGGALLLGAGAGLLALLVYLPHAEGDTAGRYFRGNTDAPRSRLHVRLFEAGTWNLPDRLRWYFHEPIYLNAEVGRWIRANLPEDSVLAADQLGQLGYYASRRQTIVDMLGLMDAHVARYGLSMEYLLEREPDHVVLYVHLDSPYWPRSWRLEPRDPGMRHFLDENREEFFRHYHPRWLLRANIPVMESGFLVYQASDLYDGEELEEVFLGVDLETFEWAWRVL